MSDKKSRKYHSEDRMRSLKEAALPTHTEEPSEPGELSRRRMLQLMAGSSAALMLTGQGCERKPRRKIVSRVDGPEYQKPGKPLYYSSTGTDGPWPYGVLVKTVDGRPVKIDGNPDHPVNRGTSDAAMHGSILSLYDPDRLRSPHHGLSEISWKEADETIVAVLRNAESVAVFTRATVGPAERAIIERFLTNFPRSRHFVHEAANDLPRRKAWRKIHGADGEIVPRLDRAKVVLSIDSDFMARDGAALENIRHFTAGRRLDDSKHASAEMSRLYVAESTMTLTGSNADHRIRLRPSLAAEFALSLLDAVNGDGMELAAFALRNNIDPTVLKSLADDLSLNRGSSLVLAGGHLHEPVHAAVSLLNESLGAMGKTMEWNTAPATLAVSGQEEVEEFLGDGVDAVICLGVNPVYDWPGGRFDSLLRKADLTIGHGMYRDETMTACSIALPSNHYLESWNDAEPRAGITTLCQPVIAPLFDTRQEAESLLVWTAALAGEADAIAGFKDWHDFLRWSWRERITTGTPWEEHLRVGTHTAPVELTAPALDVAAARNLSGWNEEVGDYSLVVHPHHSVHDGRFANNGWMQELPDPVSKMVWGNAAAISPTTAAKLQVAEGDMLKISVGDRSVLAPALVQPGNAEGTVALTLGHGRSGGGAIAKDAGGANASVLLGVEDRSRPRLAFRVSVAKAEGSRKIVRTQKQFSMQDRAIVLDGNLEEYRREAGFVKHMKHLPEPADLYDEVDYSGGHKWAMSIDLNACVGCGGCMTACQAENNIPIVGRDQCDKGREMHWMRIDRYHEGDDDNPTVHHQPMLCQHCDNAPCENVCPVNATTHSPEGLNEMTYNRCVGTRYCANNCPYKVRRFNFLRYQDAQLRDPFQELMFNPQVTVRGVGVMEKCTFCVQRINEAKFRAADSGEALADGSITTACQQACPAQAITFGDSNDEASRLSEAASSARSFHVLDELNIKPNVTYLARVRNPNPEARGEKDESGEEHEA